MEKNPLSLKRRRVLGNLYDRCETITSIPVYLDEVTDEPIGFADESLGRYMDAFSFHLPDNVCKRLASNGYIVAFDYDVSTEDNRKFTINHFVLLAPPTAVAVPRRKPVEEKVEKV